MLLCEYLVGVVLYLLLESIYVFDLDGLCVFGMSFWMLWDGEVLLVCGVLKEFDGEYGEVKLMCMVVVYLCKGVVCVML